MKNIFFLSTIMVLLVATSCNNTSETTTGKKVTADTATASLANQPQLFLPLPDSCNTPDGLAHSEDSSVVYVSMPNFNDPSYTPRIYTITNDSLQPFVDLPVHPDTKKVGPMDLAVGPDGNLYINDNQFELYDKNYKSRLLKVVLLNGKPVNVQTVVNGFRLANGMVWKGNDLYITDSQWDSPQDTAKSAIFHFTADELKKGPIQLRPGFNNPHILDTFTTIVSSDKVDNGVDGIDYDSKGALYTGIFGDGTVYKLTLSNDGRQVVKKEIFVPTGVLGSVDGFIIDRRDDKLYIADAKRNAIQKVDPNGNVSTLWKNGDTDGTNGLLDQPAEVLLKDNKLYISNFDKPSASDFTNKKYDAPHTMSIISLPNK